MDCVCCMHLVKSISLFQVLSLKLLDGWVRKCNKRELSLPSWEFGLFDRIIQMKCLLKGDDESKMPFGIGV